MDCLLIRSLRTVGPGEGITLLGTPSFLEILPLVPPIRDLLVPMLGAPEVEGVKFGWYVEVELRPELLVVVPLDELPLDPDLDVCELDPELRLLPESLDDDSFRLRLAGDSETTSMTTARAVIRVRACFDIDPRITRSCRYLS